MTLLGVDRWFFLDVLPPFCAPRFLVEASVPSKAAVVTVLFLDAGLLVAFVNWWGKTTVLSFSAGTFSTIFVPWILS